MDIAAMKELAALVFIAAAALAVGFQVALVFGAPWAHLTLGGLSVGVLPAKLRLVAVISAGVLVACIWVVGAHAGVLCWRGRAQPMGAIWLVVGVSAITTMANAITPSTQERNLWLPVAITMLLSSGYLAKR